MADSLENESVAALLSMKSQARHIPTAPSPVPARRDCSPRIRKRNRLIYNDHEDTSYTLSRSSPRKTVRVSSPVPSTPPQQLPDKRVAQKVGLKLRNLLKLPKAHRFLCCEWFYSNIDQPLFKDSDYYSCLQENFPNLKTRNMTRVEWCKIRRFLGKPRRCSPSFFAEERKSLELKRSKIRQLQLRKNVDLALFKDLPSEIPLPLVIGTKATARVRSPQDGLFYGSIDAVDTSNSTYRITFDRPGLGTFSIPDFEVLSNDPPDMMPIKAFAQKSRPRNLLYSSPRFVPISPWSQSDTDPLLGESSNKEDVSFVEDGTLGGFPKKFLALLVRLTKILAVKKKNLTLLKDMHTEAERSLSRGQPMTFDFQKSYASLVLEFERLNKDLCEYLNNVHTFCQEIAPEQGLQPVLQPSTIKDQCFKEALDYIEQKSLLEDFPVVKNQNILMLIAQLSSLMSQLKHLSTSEYNSFEFKSLSETLTEIQSRLKKQNVPVFKNEVEIHINHIRDGISQMGSLHAFASQNT
ncbi:protein lin-9 homolog [Parasteatoda tepidariorum]|uniref:protein lin-9 homolog n=1 Tax=Parasteatoda tepidariorum TaxID=114398 RepID=UPI001C719CEF|nr:protein lin-9 homolog [Parasteatoda tepidariorum]